MFPTLVTFPGNHNYLGLVGNPDFASLVSPTLRKRKSTSEMESSVCWLSQTFEFGAN